MAKKETLQNIWAMTDKPLIDIMRKKPQRLPTAHNREYSSDSDSDSNSDFTALPEEFRPNLVINKSHPQDVSPNQSLRKQLMQSPNSAFIKPTKHTPPNTSPESQMVAHEVRKQTSPLQNNIKVSSNDAASSVPKTGTFETSCQIVKSTNLRLNNEKSDEVPENAAVVRKKTLSQQTLNLINNNTLENELVQPIERPFSNELTNKKSLKYEYVQKQEQRTIQLNFDILSLKDSDSKHRLKYETKLTRNTHAKHKNAIHVENRIIKRKYINAGKRLKVPEERIPVSFETSIIRWDDSLNLNAEQDNKIEWTLVREEKTYLATRKSRGERLQLHNDLVHNCNHIRSENYRSKKFNNNSLQNEIRYSQCTKPKVINGNLGPKRELLVHRESRSKLSKPHSKTISYKNNQCSKDNDEIKRTHSIRNRDVSTETGHWDKQNNSMERYSISEQNTGNILCRCSSSETSNLSLQENVIDEQRDNREMKLSCSNKKQNRFVNSQQASSDLDDSECLNYTRKAYSHTNEKKSNLELKKDSILKYGQEISDLLIGSYMALSMFISFHRDWGVARRELIFHFEQLDKNLKESSKKFSKFTDIIRMANSGAQVAASIPHPTVSMAAKIVSVISSLLQTLLNTSKSDKANNDDSNEITAAMFKDTQSTSDLYMYGLQCSQQFEETTKLIEEFHSNIDIQGYFDNENPEITIFIRGLLEFKPNHRAFYKKLYRCFQELLQNSTTSFSKRFCEPFTLYSESVIGVIELLRWRFRSEDFDGSSVRHELQEIHNMIQDTTTTGIGELQKRIQNCVRILRDELEFMESCIKDISLFDFSMS